MLAKAHEDFYRLPDGLVLMAALSRIEAAYAAYNTVVGPVMNGYFIEMQGARTCYTGTFAVRVLADAPC